MAGIDSYTKLMLHMAGADNGTVFTDSSPSPKTVTRYGAVTSWGQQKFGNASAYFDGISYYLTLENSADFDFGAGEFTIDFWVYSLANQANFDGLVSSAKYGSGDPGWHIQLYGNTVRFSTELTYVAAATTLPNNQWVHIAIVRSGNTLTIYQNGTAVGNTDVTAYSINSGGVGLALGRHFKEASAYYAYGYIDEVRISKGIARWTADFTPPTEEYTIPGKSVSATWDWSGTKKVKTGNRVSATWDWSGTKKVKTGNRVSATVDFSATKKVKSGNIITVTTDITASKGISRVGNIISATVKWTASKLRKAPRLVSATLDWTASRGISKIGNIVSSALSLTATKKTLVQNIVSATILMQNTLRRKIARTVSAITRISAVRAISGAFTKTVNATVAFSTNTIKGIKKALSATFDMLPARQTKTGKQSQVGVAVSATRRTGVIKTISSTFDIASGLLKKTYRNISATVKMSASKSVSGLVTTYYKIASATLKLSALTVKTSRRNLSAIVSLSGTAIKRVGNVVSASVDWSSSRVSRVGNIVSANLKMTPSRGTSNLKRSAIAVIGIIGSTGKFISKAVSAIFNFLAARSRFRGLQCTSVSIEQRLTTLSVETRSHELSVAFTSCSVSVGQRQTSLSVEQRTILLGVEA